MPAPFYGAIDGTTSGTPGSGAFTPNAAATGLRAWSTVPTGWVGLVRYDDGSAWELSYSYWNGTTLSRGTNQLWDSSTGSVLSLSSSATATMVVDPSEVMSHIGTTRWASWQAAAGGTTIVAAGSASALSVSGTAASASIASTNYLTQQARVQYTSATTSGAFAGLGATINQVLHSSTAGMGGWEYVARFGASQLPTGPRMFAGMTTSTFTTADPSGLSGGKFAMFGKDSADTNIQFMTKDGTTANKIDSGITWVANGWYEACVWSEPGSINVNGLLIRLDTGDIYLVRNVSTNAPPTGTLLFPDVDGALGTTTGTAMILHFGSLSIRAGF